jgi:hypothetical protein
MDFPLDCRTYPLLSLIADLSKIVPAADVRRFHCKQISQEPGLLSVGRFDRTETVRSCGR